MAKYNKQLAIPDEIITSKIYLVRGKKVMFDEDLARLYSVTTGSLNQAVNRNIARFRMTIEKHDNPKPRKTVGFKTYNRDNP